MIIKPNKLSVGDTIGVVAPSRKISGEKVSIEAGIGILEKMGFAIKYGKNYTKRLFDNVGTPKERADDINRFFEDNGVRAIFCAIGGDSSNQLLDLMDYDKIKNNPKIFMGYSDITNLVLSIYNETGLVTFHGPNLNNLSKLTERSINHIKSLLSGQHSPKLIEEFQVIKPGKASGKLIGGNLFVINSLVKSKYCPSFKGSILFFEDVEDEVTNIKFQLHKLKLLGILEEINGMIIGHIEMRKENRKSSLTNILSKFTVGLNFPIVKTEFFGHYVKNFFAFPVGIEALVDTRNNLVKLTESSVK